MWFIVRWHRKTVWKWMSIDFIYITYLFVGIRILIISKSLNCVPDLIGTYLFKCFNSRWRGFTWRHLKMACMCRIGSVVYYVYSKSLIMNLLIRLVICKCNCNNQLHLLDTLGYWLARLMNWGGRTAKSRKFERYIVEPLTIVSLKFGLHPIMCYNFFCIISKLVLRANALLLMSSTLLLLAHVIGCRKEF